MLLANRVPVETVLLLAEDQGGGNVEGVLGSSKRERKAVCECGGENRDHDW